MAELSPAAQAVLDAAIRVAESPDAEAIVAAALRAAAWELREAYENEAWVPSPDDWLDDLATELENQ